MNTVNIIVMKNYKVCKNLSGIYYISKRLLKFQSRDELLSEEDIMHLFYGFIKLLKDSTKQAIEKKYLNVINTLKREINYLKRLKHVN